MEMGFVPDVCYSCSFEGQVNFDDQLSEKQYRNNWEGIVANTIIVPELKVK